MMMIVVQSCLNLCHPMECSMPCFPVLHYLLKSTQNCVHWVSDAIQPSHLLLPPSFSPAFNLSQHQSLFKWVPSSNPKYWSFSFSISPSNGYSGLISFLIDCFDLLAVQGSEKTVIPADICSLFTELTRQGAAWERFLVQSSCSVYFPPRHLQDWLLHRLQVFVNCHFLNGTYLKVTSQQIPALFSCFVPLFHPYRPPHAVEFIGLAKKFIQGFHNMLSKIQTNILANPILI